MTSREAQSPPKLFNMDAVEVDIYTHTFIQADTLLHACTHTRTHGHKCSIARSQTHFFLPQRQCMAGVLLQLMMKSGSDSAALSRVDALQHSAAMLRKFSVSPH